MMIKYSKITLKSGLVLPYRFIGSTVRGAFGVGLKKVVCINPSKECKGCFAREGCLFFDFFEKDNPKYRLKIDLRGKIEFDLFLFNEYSLKAPYVISAIYKAFTDIGITKKRIKPEFKLFLNDDLIYDKEFLEIQNIPQSIETEKPKEKIKLIFKTPLRIKENNRYVRNSVKLESILRSIHHRKQKLLNEPLSKLDFTPEYKIKKEAFSFVDLTRFSNRQKTKMNFGGLLGEIEFDYIDENSYKLLKLGEIIGVGKQVTFGLGDIRIE